MIFYYAFSLFLKDFREENGILGFYNMAEQLLLTS